nr:DUF5329 family protein [Kiritimatiellia bacterium]
IRNGKEYTPAEAVNHMVRKRDHFKDQITSAEDFIRLAATKSEVSGKPYLVKTADGKTEELAAWLTRELERYRKEHG